MQYINIHFIFYLGMKFSNMHLILYLFNLINRKQKNMQKNQPAYANFATINRHFHYTQINYSQALVNATFSHVTTYSNVYSMLYLFYNLKYKKRKTCVHNLTSKLLPCNSNKLFCSEAFSVNSTCNHAIQQYAFHALFFQLEHFV